MANIRRQQAFNGRATPFSAIAAGISREGASACGNLRSLAVKGFGVIFANRLVNVFSVFVAFVASAIARFAAALAVR